MNKTVRNIKRSILRRLPDGMKDTLRTLIAPFKKPAGNPAVPAEELKLFQLLSKDFKVVIDVGAREDLLFYNIKKDCSYHLFEPNQKAVALLKSQIALLDNPDITLNEFGLSDADADNCTYYENSQSFLMNPYHKGIDTGQRYSLRTLDEYVKNKAIQHVDFLKIDTEGFDYKIMQGGIDTIKTKVSYIQFEYWHGLQKFIDILGETFNLYLMMEPRLLEAITDDVSKKLTASQRSKDYTASIIAVDADIVDLFDRVLSPVGYGGNFLGINKKIPVAEAEKITFTIKP